MFGFNFGENATPEGLVGGGASSILNWLLGGTVAAFLTDTILQRSGKSSLGDLIPDSVKQLPVIKQICDGWNWLQQKLSDGLDSILEALHLKNPAGEKPANASAPKPDAPAAQPAVETPQVPNQRPQGAQRGAPAK